MNPDGLSSQARARLASITAGSGSDLDSPDFADLEAVARWRTAQHSAWGEGTTAGEVEHEPIEIAGVAGLAAGPTDAPTVLHLHAGGWSLGSAGTDAPITARLALGLRVVSIDYRLAPEHPYPAALDDAELVYRSLVDRGERVAIVGVSAGANLAIGVARRCRDRPPFALALLCPHVDLAGDRDLLPFEAAYLARHARHDPWVSPSLLDDADLATLPPTLVQWTDAERMADSIGRFAINLERVNTAVDLEMWHGLWHAWHYHRELPEAWHAVDRATSWLVDRFTIS